jgi:alginate O-acetyltransferase complex protein AlgI
VFLPIVFLLYAVLPNLAVRNALLVVASLVFYSYGEPVYVLLMIASTLFNYVFGRLVASGRGKKAWLAAAVVVNLGILGVFKYSGMVVEGLNVVFGTPFAAPTTGLPIGISFYTFQALSYVIDVYRKDVEPARNYFNILLYISFFPQLIAGPIVKYHDVDEQIRARSFSWNEAAAGMRRFSYGLAKKVLLANTCAVAADYLFSQPVASLNVLSAWTGAIAYMLQIYFDFSGYSDMAIGLGHMFGFTFQENFNYPYVSRSVQEFWRRWHISLSTWFKEYVYIPLGGNRRGKLRTVLNKIAVFFLCGLWHGANVTFIVWGLLHGALLMLEELVPAMKRMPRALGHIYTLLFVCLAFVIFRADTIGYAAGFIAKMFAGWDFSTASMVVAIRQLTPLFLATVVVACVAATPIKSLFETRLGSSRFGIASSYVLATVLLAVCFVFLSSGAYNPFIYFRF